MSNPPIQTRKRRPATTPEARENQLVSLAFDLAEKQMLDGTASSQVITHFLKAGSTREVVDKDILKLNKNLIQAKTEAIQSAKKTEELYKTALSAMRRYSGQESEEDYD